MTLTQTLSPTEGNARINSMDIIRGISLLGISLMNIAGFGLSHAYSDPTLSGGATGWNLTAWWTTSMFFEGTMRGMFSMLFGAGIIIFTNRSNDSGNGVSVTDAYFRRLLWLFLFGMIHCYLLLWHGEILYAYALCGMFAFTFRVWRPKNLVIGAIVLLSISTGLNVKDYYQLKNSSEKNLVAQAKKAQGLTLTKDETKAIEAWGAIVADKKPPQEKIDEDVAARRKGYFSIVMYKGPMNMFMETYVMYRYFFLDILAMMMLGMAFFKNGILKAILSNKFYVLLALLGYSVGLITNYMETTYIVNHKFDIFSIELTNITYDTGRVFTTIGHVALIMLFIKSGWLPILQKSLAAVGQMAFTNYIMQTVICNIIFMGFGFGLYGQLQRYELYYVVFGIWIFQTIVSPIWLKYFRFGPLEWAWRSLTYWQKQPFLKEREKKLSMA